MAAREQMKAEVERVARDAGHAAQLGCLVCDRYAFVSFCPLGAG